MVGSLLSSAACLVLGAWVGRRLSSALWRIDADARFRDIRRMLTAVQQSEQHFRELADTTPGLIWTCDARGRRSYFNRAWTEFRGRAIADEAGDGWLTGVHRDDLAAVLSITRSAVETHLPYSHEYRLLRADGSFQWMYEHAKPRFDSADAFEGFVGEDVDITRRKQVEANLREALSAVEAASRAKSAFLANTTHELRTPMTSILGFSELLLMQRDQLGEQPARQIELIHSSGRRLLALINDILDLTRIESGGLAVRELDCDPRAVIDDAVAALRPLAQEKRVDLRLAVAPDTPREICTDSLRLKQILTNLVGNAIKFTPAGGQVTIEAEADRESMLVRVVDSGIGIAPEQQPNLFKPFSQADDTIAREFGGTGLGLSISRGLAQLLGGNVTLVRSEPGAGSCFELILPTRACALRRCA